MRTRFPPEPNGFLHLGHLKAMYIDFNRSKDCILRMDDTNPETETAEYVQAIKDDVEWLGYKPTQFTSTSDYFEQLHTYAKQLIKDGFAYVDHTPSEKMREMRHAGEESESRAYAPDWHLEEFDKMTRGHYEEGTAVLRLKIDMKHCNHTLRDPVAYRICKAPHYKTGTTWCIYPLYDYSHGIVDALEGITHSYCTAEFYVRREQYLWPVLKLGLTPATVEEFGRLNIAGNVLSKRHINRFVREGVVSGYDDPRLLTIRGLRRRGWTPEALHNFISSVCSDTSDFRMTDISIEPALMDFHLRNYWNSVAPRAFAVINPLNLQLNMDVHKECEHPRNGQVGGSDKHTTLLTKNLFVEKEDYRETDDSTFYRISPQNVVRLRWAGLFIKEPHMIDGVLHMTAVESTQKKVKGTIHWVSEEGSKPAHFEHYESPLLPISKTMFVGRIESAVFENLDAIYQFERLGFYKFDRFVDEIPVFVRIVKLAEDNGKK